MTLSNHSNLFKAPAPRGGAPANVRVGVFAFAVAMMLVSGGANLLRAQTASSEAGASALEVEELKTALAVASRQLTAAEAKAEALRKSDAALRESLVESNRVAAELREQYEELLLRMASYGVDLVKPDPKSLEQRLLRSVRDREQSEKDKEALIRQLARLSEAVVGLLQTTVSSDPKAQSRIESELAAADKALGLAARRSGATAGARPMAEGKVVSVDAEIGLVVLNIGRDSGVRVGMPISVKRDNRDIGTAMVVDVRETISGALLQQITGDDDVRVGDRIEPRTEKNL